MRGTRFADDKVVRIIREADKAPVAEVATYWLSLSATR